MHTDSNIEGREALAAHVKGVVEGAVHRFSGSITRSEGHLSDQNRGKSGQDEKRCVMEARLEGSRLTAVTHQAASVDDAVDGAADQLKRSLESTLERLKGCSASVMAGRAANGARGAGTVERATS